MAGLILPTSGDLIVWGQVLFAHTYTRIPRGTDTEDAYHVPQPTPGTPDPGEPCRFQVESKPVSDIGGTYTVDTPTLYVPTDDPLDIGDDVTNIRTAPTKDNPTGLLLAAGPLNVEAITIGTMIGTGWVKTAKLRGGEPVGG